MKQFTYRWFDDIMESMAKHVPRTALRIIEVGSFEGMSTCWFLSHCPTAKIICIDHFMGGADQCDLKLDGLFARFSANVSDSASRVTVFKMDSWDAWRYIESGSADVVFVDGSHVASDVIHDLTEAFRCTVVAGIIIADDYTWHNERADCPKVAIDAFERCFGDRIDVLEKTRLFVCKKLR